MQLRTYVFLFRENGSLRHFSKLFWQQALDGKKAFDCLSEQQLKFAQIQIMTAPNHSQRIHSVRSCDVLLDTNGFIVAQDWQSLPTPELSTAVHLLFQPTSKTSNKSLNNEGKQENVLLDYLEGMFKSGQKATVSSINRLQQVEVYVEQMYETA